MSQKHLIDRICRTAVKKHHDYVVIPPSNPPEWMQREILINKPKHLRNNVIFNSIEEFLA